MAGADAIVRVDFVANTRDLQRGARDATNATKGIGSSLAGIGRKVAMAGAIAGLAALGAAARTGFKEMEEGQKVAADTNAVLKSTGGVANVTAQHVSDLATSLMKKSGVDDEAIASSENLLLTFTKVQNQVGAGNDIFDQAAKATLDYSVRFKKDLGGSATVVGKALNDPIRGMTALSKVGVTFDEGQRKTIKSMVESGDLLGAQKVILAELKKETGGAAEAYGKTLPGQIDIAKQSYANLTGELMTSLLPAFTAAMNVLQPMLAFLAKNPGVVKAIAAAIAVLSVAMFALSFATTIAAAAEVALLAPILLVAAAILALIVVVVLLWKNWDTVTAGISAAWDAIKSAIGSAVGWIGDQIRKVPGLITDAIGAIATAAAGVATAIVTGIKAGVAAAKDWIGTVISQVPGKIRNALSAVTSAAASIGSAIVTGVKSGVAAAKDWIGTVAGQIPGKITGALHAVTSAAASIGSAIVTGIKAGVAAAKDWIGTVVGQIAGKITAAVHDVTSAAEAIGSAIANGIKKGIESAVAWVGQKISGIAGKLSSLLSKIPGAGKVGKAVGGLSVPHFASGAVVTRPTLALIGEAGTEFVTPEATLRRMLAEGGGGDYVLNLTTQRADAADIAYGFRRLELLRTGR